MSDILARQRQIIGSTGEWSAHDLVLGDGELALERRSDGTVRARVGDGATQFSASPELAFGEAVLRYQGNADPTAAPPPGAAPGDVFSASPGGVVAASWGEPAAGETVAAGALLALDEGGSAHILDSAIDVSGFVTLDELAGTDDGEGADLVAFLQAGADAVPSDLRAKGRERLSLMDFMPRTIWTAIEAETNTDDLTLYIRRACATGRDVYCEGGLVFLSSGTVQTSPNLTHSGQRLWGGGTFRKTGAAQPLFAIQQELEEVVFDGIKLDGNRALYTPPIDVPLIKGWLLRSLFIRDCVLFGCIDSALKLADCAQVSVEGSTFRDCWQNGVELRNYVNDPRIPGSSTPYPPGTIRPLYEGGHRFTGCLFDAIDNGLHGGDDGCGITFDSANAAYPMLGVTVSDCHFFDIKRAVSTENHAIGAESRGVTITGNVFQGNVRGVDEIETYVAVLLAAVKGATVKGNTFRNTGNFTPGAGANTASLVVTATLDASQTSDIVIEGNIFTDDTGATPRTQYHVLLTAGRRIKVLDNIMSGASLAQIALQPSNLAQVDIRGNLGAEGSYSWGDTTAIEFHGQNFAAGTTNQLHPYGFPDDNELIAEADSRIVGISVRMSGVVTAGTLTFKVYADGVEETDLAVSFASSPPLATAAKEIALEQAVTIDAGKRIRVDAVTDASFAPVTLDAQVILTREVGMKI